MTYATGPETSAAATDMGGRGTRRLVASRRREQSERAKERARGGTMGSPALDALGDATRREIMERLRGGPRPVGEIAADLPVSRPAVSQHLRVLKEAGLVTERKEGTRRIYRLDPDGLKDLRAYLDSFWEQALAGFKAAAEKEGRNG
jgi:DNA-binding transcriptional ArsR family regulator